MIFSLVCRGDSYSMLEVSLNMLSVGNTIADADSLILCRLQKSIVNSWVLMHVLSSLNSLSRMKDYTFSWDHISAPGKICLLQIVVDLFHLQYIYLF